MQTTGTTRYIEKALDIASAMGRAGWEVVGVRPNGVILHRRSFGKDVLHHVLAASTGAT